MSVSKDERLATGTSEVVFREHHMRYTFAAQHVSGSVVMDVACGTGLGTALLRRSGASACYGFDLDLATLAAARRNVQADGFVACRAERLAVGSGALDCVVSLETIEHLAAADEFLAECARILRPGGLFVVSTPNRTVNRHWGANPHHVREFTARELVERLSRHFAEIRLFGQAPVLYPWFVVRRRVAGVAAAAGIDRSLRRLLRRPVSPPSTDTTFRPEARYPECVVAPYRPSWITRPTYLIALGRKLAA